MEKPCKIEETEGGVDEDRGGVKKTERTEEETSPSKIRKK